MRPRRAVALLEVVVALALFVAAASAVLAGLTACLRAADDVRLSATAGDLAVTVLSQVQAGILPLQDDGPVPFEPPREAWTWEIVTSPVEVAADVEGLVRVEIIVANADRAYTERLVQWVSVEQAAPAEGGTWNPYEGIAW